MAVGVGVEGGGGTGVAVGVAVGVGTGVAVGVAVGVGVGGGTGVAVGVGVGVGAGGGDRNSRAPMSGAEPAKGQAELGSLNPGIRRPALMAGLVGWRWKSAVAGLTNRGSPDLPFCSRPVAALRADRLE